MIASRFWVGGTGTWDAATTTNWAATSGGAGGQSVPGSSDDVTFDASSGGGTVTVNFGGTITINSLTCGAFGGTLDFATNDNNVTILGANGFSGTGTGTRTINLGDGTWTLSNAAALWTFQTVTNLTFNANGSTIAFTTASTSAHRFLGGGRTYNIVTFAGGANSNVQFNGANTFGTLTIGAPNRCSFSNSATTTITTFTNISGSSSGGVLIEVDDPRLGVATISSANNWTGDWCGFHGVTFSGGGTFAGTNSLNFGRTSGITITAPSGSGVVGVIGG